MSTMIIYVDIVNWYSMSLSIKPLKHVKFENRNNLWPLLCHWYKTLPPCVPSPVEGKLVVQSLHHNHQFMEHSISSLRTHSPMENDTTILVDASPLFSPHSVAPSNYGVDFDSLENMGIDVEEGSGSKPIIPTPRRRYKWTVKRIVKFVAICKSLFVSQCLTQFLKITHQER